MESLAVDASITAAARRFTAAMQKISASLRESASIPHQIGYPAGLLGFQGMHPTALIQLELLPDERTTLVCPSCSAQIRLERQWVAMRAHDIIGCPHCGMPTELPDAITHGQAA